RLFHQTILFVLALSVHCSVLQAQTDPAAPPSLSIESVLRALQERQMILVLKNNKVVFTPEPGGAIVWPGDLAELPFPPDGTIKTLPDAITALNAAVTEYNFLAGQFIA